MARTEARIYLSVWDDDDFRALPPDAQWAYFFLVSQSDMTHLGVLPLRTSRWVGRSAKGMTRERLGEALGELERGHYIVVDRDTAELLVRSYIRRDKVFRQPQILRAGIDTLPQVTSVALRRALLMEAHRILDEEEMTAPARAVVEDLAAVLRQSVVKSGEIPAVETETAEHSADDSLGESPDQSAAHSAEYPSDETAEHSAPQSPGDRGRVTAVTTRVPRSPFPVPRAGGDHPSPQTAAKPRAAPNGTRLPEPFEPDEELLVWAKANHPTIDALAQTEAFVDYWRAKPGQAGRKLDWRATWRTWIRKANEYGAGNGRASPPSTAPTKIPESQRCPEHHDQRATTCRHCRAKTIAKEPR